MGVKGLTTYIERNKDKYLKDHKLHDTSLVIDGNSLCAQLYKFYAKCNDEFGGDYDKFAKCIKKFFEMLKQCNISPIVILDGGYELKKLRTVNYRLQNKLKIIQSMNPASTDWTTIFPLFHREAFKDVVLKLNIPLVRTDFEADLEIACVARKLNCPVLSYDSDFFIYDTLYIPFNTLDFYTTKIDNDNGSKYCICCKIYKVDVFLKRCHIDKTLLPLMATLLGNDYIKKNVFTKFYNHIKLPKRKGSRSEQHRTIIALIKWLENQTFDSAVRKVLSRLKQHERHALAREIKKVTQGYICSYSELFEYLGLTNTDNEEKNEFMDIDPDDVSENEDEENDNNSDDSDSTDEDSDEMEDVDLSIEENEKAAFENEWFKKNIRNGNFPTLFMDILSLKMGIYQPQIEDTSNIETFNIFMPILKCIAKILLEDKSYKFSYLGRTENCRAKRYYLQVSKLNLPKVSEIEHLNKKICQQQFLSTLYILPTELKKILQFPEQWQLYLLSVVYWIRKATYPKINYCHLSSLILCMLHISLIDEIVPNIRDKNYFSNKYNEKLKSILEARKEVKSNADETTDSKIKDTKNNLVNAVKHIGEEDSLFYIDALVSNFKINEKVKSNKNLFSIHIIDAFAQFQNCLLHIKYLNALFKFPLPNFDICTLYNGTYIYNMYINLEKRNDIDAYIELILKNSPSLLKIYKQIISILKDMVHLEPNTKTNKKRKRKKRKTVTEADEEIIKESKQSNSDSDNDTLFDHNNKFAVLALAD